MECLTLLDENDNFFISFKSKSYIIGQTAHLTIIIMNSKESVLILNTSNQAHSINFYASLRGKQ